MPLFAPTTLVARHPWIAVALAAPGCYLAYLLSVSLVYYFHLAGTGGEPHATPSDGPTGVHAAQPQAYLTDFPPLIRRDPDHVVSFDVPITNATGALVRFKDFRCDCGCTAGHMTEYELPPGGTGSVRMTVRLDGRHGEQRFSCRWDDEAGRPWVATARVTVYRPAQFEPSLVHLGQVAAGQTVQRRVVYEEYAATEDTLPPVPTLSTGTQRHDFVKLVTHTPAIEQLATGFVRRQTTTDVQITIPSRGGYGSIVVEPDQGGGTTPTPRTAALVDWSVRELIEVVPARVAFTFRSASDRQSQIVRVTDVSGSRVAVGSVETTNRAIQAKLVPSADPARPSLDVEVSVAVPADRTFVSGEVVLKFAAPTTTEVRIPVSALIVSPSHAPTGP